MLNPNTSIDAYEVKGDLNIEASGRGTKRSAINEALRAPEQKILDRVKANKETMLNERNATLPENVRKWMKRHNIKLGDEAISPSSWFFRSAGRFWRPSEASNEVNSIC